MSRRELKSLGATEVPDHVLPEPEPDFEDGRDEEGVAEAARQAATKAAVEEELARARGSARDLKEALGKRLPLGGEVAAWRSSLCCLAASAPNFGLLSELVSVSGATVGWGAAPELVVDAILAREVVLRPPPPPAPETAEERFQRELQARFEAAEAREQQNARKRRRAALLSGRRRRR